MGPQLRQRFHLVSGSMGDLVRQLAAFGLNSNHVEAVFRSEIAHRQYFEKWMKSIEIDTDLGHQRKRRKVEPDIEEADEQRRLGHISIQETIL
jgi:hypothetical protein